jgi:hypothetical protein
VIRVRCHFVYEYAYEHVNGRCMQPLACTSLAHGHGGCCDV